MGGPNQDVSLELKEAQVEYLKEMANKYGLADESKALRCLISFAREEADREADIFDEIRCLDC